MACGETVDRRGPSLDPALGIESDLEHTIPGILDSSLYGTRASTLTSKNVGSAEKIKELLTASRVAEFCQVDLKTIHNWAERGRIPHFRTPGRHLRFRREDVLDFLRKYGYPIPPEIAGRRPRVLLMLEESPQRLKLRAVLESDFEVFELPDAMAGLLSIGREPPDAVVLGHRVGPLSSGEIIAALQQSDNARHVRTVVATQGKPGPLVEEPSFAGASARVPLSNPSSLRDTLGALMGIGR